jgi:signal transduction histidine kinase
MKIISSDLWKKWRGLLLTQRPDPTQQAERIIAMQRDVVLPSKAGIFLVVFVFLFSRGWFSGQSTQSVVHGTFQIYFLAYILCNILGAICFAKARQIPAGLYQWLTFTLGLLDGLFMTGLVVVTGGFASMGFWVFPGLIVLNAWSIPLAIPQIVLNLLLSLFYLTAVLLTPSLDPTDTVITGNPVSSRGVASMRGTNLAIHLSAATNSAARRSNVWPNSSDLDAPEDIPSEQLLLRVSVLWLLTLCCYGAQVLSERQRQAIQEAAEFAAREGQLHSAGRLAAEFTHQIKNPLAIISNAAFSLQRSLRENKNSTAQQIEIIREEVARADKVIIQIMGYAQLSEGRVEKLDVVEEMNKAIEQVFPRAVPSNIHITKSLTQPFPPLLMQRGHLSEILVNLLQNAREALNGHGRLGITAKADSKNTVEIVISDDGPGIAPEKISRIFEAYFTTKEKGTGLGLSIVKHNVELYGGTVRVESVLGHGATFTVSFPAKSLPKPFVK